MAGGGVQPCARPRSQQAHLLEERGARGAALCARSPQHRGPETRPPSSAGGLTHTRVVSSVPSGGRVSRGPLPGSVCGFTRGPDGLSGGDGRWHGHWNLAPVSSRGPAPVCSCLFSPTCRLKSARALVDERPARRTGVCANWKARFPGATGEGPLLHPRRLSSKGARGSWSGPQRSRQERQGTLTYWRSPRWAHPPGHERLRRPQTPPLCRVQGWKLADSLRAFKVPPGHAVSRGSHPAPTGVLKLCPLASRGCIGRTPSLPPARVPAEKLEPSYGRSVSKRSTIQSYDPKDGEEGAAPSHGPPPGPQTPSPSLPPGCRLLRGHR